MNSTRSSFLILLGAITLGVTVFLPSADASEDQLALQLRYRREISDAPTRYAIDHRLESWPAKETAVIVCDMWDAHHCLNAVRRETEMAPRMNRFLDSMRERGALIIHAPSSCMAAYEDHPGRALAKEAPAASNLPDDISQWCDQIPSEESAQYPIDQTDGGEDDDPAEHQRWHEQLTSQGRNPRSPWLRQIDLIEIQDGDAISDQGDEIWNLLEHRNIQQVMLVGVHTNMCVLGRPFGLRQLAKNGKNVVLVRDLTDTMYNPKSWPFVSHVTGTDLIVEHIEKHVCPTITSDQILGDRPFRFASDQRPHLVCLLAESEYNTAETIPDFLSQQLRSTFRVSYVHADPQAPQTLLGWRELEHADLIFVSVRRRALPKDQLDCLKKRIRLGVPVVGIRTASHAFSLNGKEPLPEHEEWSEFDREIFGGNYHMHHGNKQPEDPRTAIWIPDSATEEPIVAGLLADERNVTSWLYKTEPLAPGTTPLLMGRVGTREPIEPVAWTYINPYGGRSFYTSLGHQDEFNEPFFRELLTRGLLWCAAMPEDLETDGELVPEASPE